MGRWAGGQVGRWAGGQVGRWAGGQVGRWAGGHRVYVLAINDFACCSLVCEKRKPDLELKKKMFCCLLLSQCHLN